MTSKIFTEPDINMLHAVSSYRINENPKAGRYMIALVETYSSRGNEYVIDCDSEIPYTDEMLREKAEKDWKEYYERTEGGEKESGIKELIGSYIIVDTEPLWDAMKEKRRDFALHEAASYTDKKAFVSDMILADFFNDGRLHIEEADYLSRVWNTVHIPMKELLEEFDVTQIQFARRFNIPLRSVQNWCSGVRACPVYVRTMASQLMEYI